MTPTAIFVAQQLPMIAKFATLLITVMPIKLVAIAQIRLLIARHVLYLLMLLAAAPVFLTIMPLLLHLA